MEQAVYAKPTSPYYALLRWAGIELADLRSMVLEQGLEGALEQLYDAGVYVTIDEFKGRKPIQREGLNIPTSAGDFDNPLLRTHIYGSSSGSRGTPFRTKVDLDHIAAEAAYMTFGLPGFEQRPLACWGSGLDRVALRYAKAGKRVTRNFSTLAPATGVFARVSRSWSRLGNRLVGFGMPPVEYVPPGEVSRIASWLADKKGEGTPAMVTAFATPAVRICSAARELGLDISGTTFIVVGEPFTAAKAEIVRSVGATANVGYAMSEIGYIGRSCAHPSEPDEVHIFTDKLAVVTPERVTSSGTTVAALFLTAAELTAPKIALNMESGDYGQVFERPCGCPLEEAGFRTHLSGIRSYEKLTSESVTFLGSALFELLEEVLPARFGGQIADYQLVEEEVEGLPKVSILVAPSVGPVDEAALVNTVLETLSQSSLPGPWVELWRESDTLRVIRRPPYESRAKVQPLHILGAGARVSPR
jgi:hypothetical protein